MIVSESMTVLLSASDLLFPPFLFPLQWALSQLGDSDEDDDLLCRTGNFIASSESLPRGILKVKASLLPPQFGLCPCFSVAVWAVKLVSE